MRESSDQHEELSEDPLLIPDEGDYLEPELVLSGQTERAGQTTDSGRGRIFPCDNCGADLHFDIGQQRLKCPYCGSQKEIELDEAAQIVEQDYHAMLERLADLRARGVPAGVDEHNEVRCESCGADVVFVGTLTSKKCPYCASPIQRENVHTATFRVPVDGVLPFLVDHDRAQRRLTKWIKSLWFAPTRFQREGVRGNFEGVYLPYWTFDTLTFSKYAGERGVNYTTTTGTGKNRRTVTKIRWYPVSGQFQRFFDDVLVCATRGLPQNYIQALEPWPLGQCLPFTQQVLAGHFARTYEVELDDGLGLARQRIDAALQADVRRRIGGDHQRIHRLNTRYDAITYKHLLLPVWMLVYRYHDHPYRVFINAATGEVQGERPYSWVKIGLTVLAVAAVIAVIVAIANS
jgi:predicted RNA-binding Zn-ribbon protein involved in translation (DUF1610 family)